MRVVGPTARNGRKSAGSGSPTMYVARNRGLIQLQAAFYPALTFCFQLSGLIVLWLGRRDVIAHRLTLGRVRHVQPVSRLLSWPVIAFGWVIRIVQRSVASWGRMLEVMDAPGSTDRFQARIPNSAPGTLYRNPEPGARNLRSSIPPSHFSISG